MLIYIYIYTILPLSFIFKSESIISSFPSKPINYQIKTNKSLQHNLHTIFKNDVMYILLKKGHISSKPKKIESKRN